MGAALFVVVVVIIFGAYAYPSHQKTRGRKRVPLNTIEADGAAHDELIERMKRNYIADHQKAQP